MSTAEPLPTELCRTRDYLRIGVQKSLMSATLISWRVKIPAGFVGGIEQKLEFSVLLGQGARVARAHLTLMSREGRFNYG
jgi:hypothetical protein